MSKETVKRIVSGAIASLMICSVALNLSACQDMKDIIPSSYGEWDGNYIYRGNGRAKTTGENYEQLITSVELFGETCSVLNCIDFEVENDDMYLILECEYDNLFNGIYCLVKYDLKEKTHVLLTYEMNVTHENVEFYYRPVEIDGIYEDCIVLQALCVKSEYLGVAKNFEDVWYTIGLDGSIQITQMAENFKYATWVSEEYLIEERYNSVINNYELFYRKGHFSEPVSITYLVGDGKYSEWMYVENNGRKGLLVQGLMGDYDSVYGGRKISKISFFDFETQKLTYCNVNAYAVWTGEREYLKIYDKTTVEYKTRRETLTGTTECNNKIYKVIYDENGIHLELLYDLPEFLGYNIYAVTDDKLLYRECWYESASGCATGGPRSQFYEHDLTADTRREIDNKENLTLEDKYAEVYELEKGVQFGVYIYFLHTETIYEGLMASSSLAYLLKRYDTQTKKVEVMQLWHRDKESVNQAYSKYSAELWFTPMPIANEVNRYDFHEFIVRNY